MRLAPRACPEHPTDIAAKEVMAHCAGLAVQRLRMLTSYTSRAQQHVMPILFNLNS